MEWKLVPLLCHTDKEEDEIATPNIVMNGHSVLSCMQYGNLVLPYLLLHTSPFSMEEPASKPY